MADVFDQYEISRSGREMGSSRAFYGERVCVLTDALKTSLAPHYDPLLGAESYWPNTTGIFRAKLDEYRLEKARPGRWILTLIYRQPSVLDVLREGRAYLTIRISAASQPIVKAKTAAGNELVIGPDPNDPLGKWQIVDGRTTELVPFCDVAITTVMPFGNVPAYMDLVNKVNDSTLSNVGGARRGTLLFLGMEIGGTLIQRKYWSVRYRFMYHPLVNGQSYWMIPGKAQKFVRRAVLAPLYDTSGQVKGSTQQHVVMGWSPVGNKETIQNDVTYASFSKLNGMLSWL